MSLFNCCVFTQIDTLLPVTRYDLPEVFLSGIYGVGKAAEHPPALAVLSHTPEGATQTIAWVGKGIVYDTGGLSIKGKVLKISFCEFYFFGLEKWQKLKLYIYINKSWLNTNHFTELI